MISLPASTVVNSPEAAGVSVFSTEGVSVLLAGVSALPLLPPPQAASRDRDMTAVRPMRASFLKFFILYSLLFIAFHAILIAFLVLGVSYYTPYANKCNIYSFVKPHKKPGSFQPVSLRARRWVKRVT